VELSPDPFFVDAVRVQLSGMLNSRLRLRAGGSYADGRLQLVATDRRTTYSGSARLGYALSRQLELAAGYAEYFYDFGAQTELPSGIPAELNRRTFQISLSYWIPLLLTR
jgi:hypothetical protein